MAKIAALKGSSNFHPNATSTPNKFHKNGAGNGTPKSGKRRASWIDPEDGEGSGKTYGKGTQSPGGARKKAKKAHRINNAGGPVAGGSKQPTTLQEQRANLPIAQGA